MSDRSGAKPTIHLRDYRPPAWRVERIALEFDLDAASTLVTALLELEQREEGSPLRLDAEALELLDVQVDGRRLDAGEFTHADAVLTIPGVAGRVVVGTRVRIEPARNTALQGLYLSGSAEDGFLLTQCEAEGFRRITPFPDRSDVLARYEVTLRADARRFPLLLCNGDRVDGGTLADGRHWARFVDPHPKPSYLFALVAGRLDHIEDAYTTAEGRHVRLFIHAEPAVVARCGWAMDCLKQAMQWDERRFGRCYDLDVFHIVATGDFTMGAMENKGLNIFNSKYLLASPDSATDDDYRHVLAVVGHEYFHNWSGNRVTCRDWFQLCLKEGLTVYREQEFESDVASRTLRRIEDVRLLWRAQFAEDAGPLAHPVRPDHYSEINNFYTATVYEKGAEIARMLAVVLGREGFRRGLDLYFGRHDGEAATVEDFLAALGDANGTDLSPWLAWYEQAGTPVLRVAGRHDAQQGVYELTLGQHTPPTPGQAQKLPLPIPVAIALYDGDGRPLPLRLEGEDEAAATRERVLLLDGPEATWRFVGVPAEPVPSLLRGYSAPVRLLHEADARALAIIARHDGDGFNRWFAADALARRLFAQALAQGGPEPPLLEAWLGCLGDVLADDRVDPALAAEMLTLADATSLGDGLSDIDPEAVHAARARIEFALAAALQPALLAAYERLRPAASGDGLAAQAARRLRNACLAALCRANRAHAARAHAQLAAATNLTDRLAALAALLAVRADGVDAALDAFAQRHAADPLVLDKWFALQASEADPDACERVTALLGHRAFRWTNPNNVYSLLGVFAQRNPRAFHRADGAGYRLVTDAVLRLDVLTPQVAARLATAFGGWRRYEPSRRALMRGELERVRAREGLSPDVSDIVARTLGDAEPA